MSFSNKRLINNNFNLSTSQNLTSNDNSRNINFIPLYKSINFLSDKRKTINQTYHPNLPNISAINKSSFSPKKGFRTIEPLDDSISKSPKNPRPIMNYFIKPRVLSIRENVLNKLRKENAKTYSELNINREPKDHITFKSHSNDFGMLRLKSNFYSEKKPKDRIITFFKGDYIGGLPSHSVFHFKTSNEKPKMNTSIESEYIQTSNFNVFNENKKNKEEDNKQNKNKKKNYEKDPLDNIGSSVMNLIKNNRNKLISKNQKKPLDSIKPELDNSINEDIEKIIINKQKVKLKNSLNITNNDIAPHHNILNDGQLLKVNLNEKEKKNITNENKEKNEINSNEKVKNIDKVISNTNGNEKEEIKEKMEAKEDINPNNPENNGTTSLNDVLLNKEDISMNKVLKLNFNVISQNEGDSPVPNLNEGGEEMNNTNNSNNKNKKLKINDDINDDNSKLEMDSISDISIHKINVGEYKMSNLSKKNEIIFSNNMNENQNQEQKNIDSIKKNNEKENIIEEKNQMCDNNKEVQEIQNKKEYIENEKRVDIKEEKDLNEIIKKNNIESNLKIEEKADKIGNLEKNKKNVIKEENKLKGNINKIRKHKKKKEGHKYKILVNEENESSITINLYKEEENNIDEDDIKDIIDNKNIIKDNNFENEHNEKLYLKSNNSYEGIKKENFYSESKKNENSENNQKENKTEKEIHKNLISYDGKTEKENININEAKEEIMKNKIIDQKSTKINLDEKITKDKNEKKKTKTNKEKNIFEDKKREEININEDKKEDEEKKNKKNSKKDIDINKIIPNSKKFKTKKLTPKKFKKYKTEKTFKKSKAKYENKTEKINKKIKAIINNNNISEFKITENDKNTNEDENQKIVNKPKEPKDLNINKELKYDEYFNPSDFKYLGVLGEGEFGKIYLAQWVNRDNKFYAMKIEKFNTLEESLKSQQKTKLIKDFLKSTNSEGVVRIYGDICINVNDIYQYYVLMEKAERDLEQELVIRCNNNAFYSEEDLINILCQLILVLAEMQKNNIAHRDIKPQNILITKGRFKIADFGEAKIFKNGGEIIQIISGTELYMSPILFFAMRNNIEKVKHNAYKSDVFSLGLCLLLAATLNYDSLCQIRELSDMNEIKNILMFYLSGRYSFDFISFLLRMLEFDEKIRPDFIQLENMLVKK